MKIRKTERSNYSNEIYDFWYSVEMLYKWYMINIPNDFYMFKR